MRIPSSLKPFLKILFSLAMLAVLFHEVHIKEIIPYLKQIHVTTYIIAITILFAGNTAAIFRWTLIMKTLGAPPANRFYFKTFLIGLMFNQVLPSSIGGDGYRMIEITKLGLSKRQAITSVLADRIVGFAGMIILCLLALPITYHLLSHLVFIYISLLVCACCAALVMVSTLRFIKISLFQRYLRWFYDLSETFAASFSSLTDLTFKLILSVITNGTCAISFYFIAVALGIPAHLTDFIIIIPLVSLIMMIPISMAGWGIREGAMVYFGALIGISHPAALAISLLSGLILIINSAPGFYFYFLASPKIPQVDLNQAKS